MKIFRNIIVIVAIATGVIYFTKPFKVQYEIKSFDIYRINWESISVNADYKSKTIFRENFVTPYKEVLIIKDQNSNVIYKGSVKDVIEIPDKDLGSEEQLSVELIASFDEKDVSKIDYIYASKKRFTMQSILNYPKGDFAMGNYNISFSVKRKLFKDVNTDELLYSDIYIPFEAKVYLDTDDSNSVLFKSTSKNDYFDLSDDSNYSNFRDELWTKLSSSPYSSVDVKFEIKMDYHGVLVYFNPIVKTLKNKSEYQKKKDAKYFGEKLGRKMIDAISPNTGTGLDVRINENSIVYDLKSMKYTIPLRISWSAATWIFGDKHDMIVEGVLTVNEDGSNPEFEKSWSNSSVNKAIETNSAWQGTVYMLDELGKQGAFD